MGPGRKVYRVVLRSPGQVGWKIHEYRQPRLLRGESETLLEEKLRMVSWFRQRKELTRFQHWKANWARGGRGDYVTKKCPCNTFREKKKRGKRKMKKMH